MTLWYRFKLLVLAGLIYFLGLIAKLVSILFDLMGDVYAQGASNNDPDKVSYQQYAEIERRRTDVIAQVAKLPTPCLVCGDRSVVNIGTWIPDSRYSIAVGGPPNSVSILGFWLCEAHTDKSPKNVKLIEQAAMRYIQAGPKMPE